MVGPNGWRIGEDLARERNAQWRETLEGDEEEPADTVAAVDPMLHNPVHRRHETQFGDSPVEGRPEDDEDSEEVAELLALSDEERLRLAREATEEAIAGLEGMIP